MERNLSDKDIQELDINKTVIKRRKIDRRRALFSFVENDRRNHVRREDDRKETGRKFI